MLPPVLSIRVRQVSCLAVVYEQSKWLIKWSVVCWCQLVLRGSITISCSNFQSRAGRRSLLFQNNFTWFFFRLYSLCVQCISHAISMHDLEARHHPLSLPSQCLYWFCRILTLCHDARFSCFCFSVSKQKKKQISSGCVKVAPVAIAVWEADRGRQSSQGKQECVV